MLQHQSSELPRSPTSSADCQINPRTKPRQKRHHHKSRAGCHTCKRRKVKCGEERPSCVACLRNDLQCGYTPDFAQQDGLVIIAYQPRPSSHVDDQISFFRENSIPLLTNMGAKYSLTSDHNDNSIFDHLHESYDRFWRRVVLPMAHTEPNIFQLIALFGKRHRLALTEGDEDFGIYSRMLSIMAKIARDQSLEVVLVAVMLLFAYERLQSAATGNEPSDKYHVHYSVAMSLLQKSPAMREYIVPLLMFTWERMSFWTEGGRTGDVHIPDVFEGCSHATSCFAEILQFRRSSGIRTMLAQWSAAIMGYYEEVRGKDWDKSKQVLMMLSEYQLLRTAFELALAEQRNAISLSMHSLL